MEKTKLKDKEVKIQKIENGKKSNAKEIRT